MYRLIELLFFALLIYMTYRRLVAPARRGFAERERERGQERHARQWGIGKKESRIDRSSVKDAEFKDLK